MQVRCPNCENTLDIAAESTLDGALNCPSCGSHFNLSGDETQTLDNSPTTVAHFELVERLGLGSFGAVWRARDSQLDRYVAVKMPRPDRWDARNASQFLREAQTAAQLQHRNIVSIHEVGRHEDLVYIVSEFVKGTTLADRLTAWQPSVREAAQLCASIADGLDHAHETGVVHRDLKPANIMIDLDGQPRVMDFGLALRETAVDATVSIEGKVLGTPAYMPPEQAQGEGHTADRRADVYSLGVILFELVTGERPFRGNPRMLMHQVMHVDPPSPRSLNSVVPRDIETIVLKCLAKSPAARYATAAELAADLRRWLNREPIHARPVGPIGKAVRWCQRRPAVAALVATVVAVAVAGFVGIETQRRRAVENFEKSEDLRLEAQANLEESVRQRTRRQANYERALEAVDRMLTRVAQRRLLNTPEMSAIRRELLVDAVGFYQELMTEETSDLDLRAETALAHYRVGNLHAMMGDVDAAIKSYDVAHQMLRTLVDENPEHMKYVRGLAAVVADRGAQHALRGDLATAEAGHREALELHRLVADSDPQDDQYRLDVATRLVSIAGICQKQNRAEEAEKLYLEAQELFSNLDDEIFQEPIAIRNHGYAFYGLADLYTLTGRREESLAAYRTAIGLYEKIFELAPDHESYRDEHLDFQRGYAVVLITLGNSTDAEAVFRKLNESRVTLASNFPRIPGYRKSAASSYNDLGILYARSGQFDKALEAFTNGVELNEALVEAFPETLDYRRGLGYDYNNLANLQLQRGNPDRSIDYHRKAYAVRKQLVAESPTAQALQSELAITIANLGGALQNQGSNDDEAEQMLREAVTLGQQLANESPDVPVHRHKLALARRSLASFLHGRDNDAAVEQIQAALALSKQLVEQLPNDPRYAQQWAISHDKLGEVLLSKQQDDEAIMAFRRAEEILGDLQERFDGQFELGIYHALSNRKLARALDLIGEHEEAKQTFEACLMLIDGLSAKSPDNPQLLHELAKSRNAFAWFLTTCSKVELRDAERANQLATQAVEAVEDDPDYWGTLALARHRSEDSKGAVEAIEQAMSIAGEDVAATDQFLATIIRMGQGDETKARAAYDRAIALQEAGDQVASDRLADEAISWLRIEATQLLKQSD